MLMLCDPSTVMPKAVNEILAPSMIDSEVKETSVGISIFEIGNSRALPFPRMLEHGQANHLALEPPTNIQLLCTQRTAFLGHIQTENDL